MDEVTQTCTAEEDGFDIFSCDNCGAYAGTPQDIQHHPTCRPGESKRWEEFYAEGGEEC